MNRANLSTILERAKVDHLITARAVFTSSGTPRLTRDVDIHVKPTPLNLRRLAGVVKYLGFGPKVSVTLVNFLDKEDWSQKRRRKNNKSAWTLLSDEELCAYAKITPAEKLRWLEKVKEKLL